MEDKFIGFLAKLESVAPKSDRVTIQRVRNTYCAQQRSLNEGAIGDKVRSLGRMAASGAGKAASWLAEPAKVLSSNGTLPDSDFTNSIRIAWTPTEDPRGQDNGVLPFMSKFGRSAEPKVSMADINHFASRCNIEVGAELPYSVGKIASAGGKYCLKFGAHDFASVGKLANMLSMAYGNAENDAIVYVGRNIAELIPSTLRGMFSPDTEDDGYIGRIGLSNLAQAR